MAVTAPICTPAGVHLQAVPDPELEPETAPADVAGIAVFTTSPIAGRRSYEHGRDWRMGSDGQLSVYDSRGRVIALWAAEHWSGAEHEVVDTDA